MAEKISTSISTEFFDKENTFQGLAVRSKAGACIKLEDGNIIFIENMLDWEDELLNQELIVIGTLVEKKIIPDVTIDEDGAISQGAEGKQFLLEKIKKIEPINQ